MTAFSHRPKSITPAEARVAVQALAANDGNVSATARALGVTRAKLQRRLRAAERWGITAHGAVQATHARDLDPVGPGKGPRRFLLTCAQNNTAVHGAFWANLLALADHYGAEILVARIRYNHNAAQVGQEKVNRASDDALWYPKEVEPYFADDRVRLAPDLIWAGDMNIIPTATNPLSGLDSFTGAASCIFPHPQIALKSIATAPGTPAKFNVTTGAATLKNYIGRKAGLKAEFHHAYGATLVEIDRDGDWFIRQVNATDAGVICDLDVMVEGGKVTTGHRLEVFTPGDIHGTELDPDVRRVIWGDAGLVDTMRPRHQVLHDVLNFGRRSHHATFFDQVAAFHGQGDSVAQEVVDTAAILAGLQRPWMQTYVAKSNHDEHLDRWVLEADFKRDPANARFYLKMASAKVDALAEGRDNFDLVAYALEAAGLTPMPTFLGRSDPLTLAGIRHDQHGDLGPNGSRGSAANIARTGDKANIGHSHSAAIVQGCYQAGTFSKLDMGYNRGPSSWSHSAVLTYANGKRTVATVRAGKWRA